MAASTSLLTQAKRAEAQKLIKQYNKLQAEAKSGDMAVASRKASEAQKLVAQISLLQADITKLQAKDKERDAAKKTGVLGGSNSALATVEENIRQTEADKTALEARIARIETAQKKTRDQIDQLNRAKGELARLKSEAKQNKERRSRDEKLQQELTNLIEKKESDHNRMRQELGSIRDKAEKDAELLRVQRDAARKMMERQQSLEKDQFVGSRNKGSKGLILGIVISIIIFIGVGFALLSTGIISLGNKSNSNTVRTNEVQQVQTEEKTPLQNKSKQEKIEQIVVKPQSIFRDKLSSGGAGPIMVKLPDGVFLMGSKNTSPYQDERPQHRVSLQGFSIGKFEVTFDEYDRFAKAMNQKLPKDRGWGRGNRPVINVSWDEAVAYTKWLTEQTGNQYRLPSEREWEYAASAGLSQTYWWGYKLKKNYANCSSCGSEWDGKRTAPVGKFPANPAGLHDVIGNVMEWTRSCFRSTYKHAPQYGQAWEGGDCSKRMVRSSSYRSYENALRTTKRNKYSSKTRMDTLGFRVVRVN